MDTPLSCGFLRVLGDNPKSSLAQIDEIRVLGTVRSIVELDYDGGIVFSDLQERIQGNIAGSSRKIGL